MESLVSLPRQSSSPDLLVRDDGHLQLAPHDSFDDDEREGGRDRDRELAAPPPFSLSLYFDVLLPRARVFLTIWGRNPNVFHLFIPLKLQNDHAGFHSSSGMHLDTWTNNIAGWGWWFDSWVGLT